MIFEIWIPGKPVAWARAGDHRLPDGRVIKYDRDKQRSWKAQFVADAKRQLLDQGALLPLFCFEPVRLVIVVGSALPNSEHRKRAPVPASWNVRGRDWDNLGKLVSDAGNNLLWSDDRQVVCGEVMKMFMPQGEPAGVGVFAEAVPDLRLDGASLYLDRARRVAGLLREEERRTG